MAMEPLEPCEIRITNALPFSCEMTQVYYLGYDPRMIGPRGGDVVRPSNLGRHFTPTAFKDLVTRGWIGTITLAAEVVVPVIMAAMAGSPSIVLAVQSTAPDGSSEDP